MLSSVLGKPTMVCTTGLQQPPPPRRRRRRRKQKRRIGSRLPTAGLRPPRGVSVQSLNHRPSRWTVDPRPPFTLKSTTIQTSSQHVFRLFKWFSKRYMHISLLLVYAFYYKRRPIDTSISLKKITGALIHTTSRSTLSIWRILYFNFCISVWSSSYFSIGIYLDHKASDYF